LLRDCPPFFLGKRWCVLLFELSHFITHFLIVSSRWFWWCFLMVRLISVSLVEVFFSGRVLSMSRFSVSVSFPVLNVWIGCGCL
jgi:hypothetical protein